MHDEHPRSQAAHPPHGLDLEVSEQAYVHLVCLGLLHGRTPQAIAEQLLSQGTLERRGAG